MYTLQSIESGYRPETANRLQSFKYHYIYMNKSVEQTWTLCALVDERHHGIFELPSTELWALMTTKEPEKCHNICDPSPVDTHSYRMYNSQADIGSPFCPLIYNYPKFGGIYMNPTYYQSAHQMWLMSKFCSVDIA